MSAGPRRALARLEDGVLVAALAAMVLLPCAEVLGRRFGLPSTILPVQYLTLVVGFLGAAVAAREGRHLAVSPLAESLRGRAAAVARVVAAAAGVAVAGLLAWASTGFVLEAVRPDTRPIALVPKWIWALALPVGLALVAVRQLRVGARGPGERAAALLLALAALSPGLLSEEGRGAAFWPGMAAVVVALALGAPLFAVLGGAALLLCAAEGIPVQALPNAAFDLVVSPTLPAIPLFTLAGYALAEGGASRRLVRLFRALFGWLPGGLAVAAACVCAFFTTFTGGSGVTILALGGLLLPALLASGYRDRYSLGLLTASGSLGLLFPPSLPVILYGVVANAPIADLFAGALLPGVVLLAVVAATGVLEGARTGAGRAPFALAEARAALWEAKWELLLPAVVLFLMFGGLTTPVEAAAVTALYALLVESLVHRDLTLRRGLPGALLKTGVLVGGVLLILAVAKGLASGLVDAQVPERAAEWVRGAIETRWGFLLALNLFLLAVGCLMDIYSAIVVVVPIILPMAAAYGVDPVHLGVIFLANLELGYLTPPVGLNLFLASFRFERPFLEVCRAALPFLLLLAAAVLLITYVPWLTLAGVRAFGGGAAAASP